MSRTLAIILLGAMSTGAAYAQGDTLEMGSVDTSAFEQAGKPTRGMSQDSVRASFGNPQSTEQAVGEPPISRWHYADFVVYFEFDRVIHAVSKR